MSYEDGGVLSVLAQFLLFLPGLVLVANMVTLGAEMAAALQRRLDKAAVHRVSRRSGDTPTRRVSWGVRGGESSTRVAPSPLFQSSRKIHCNLDEAEDFAAEDADGVEHTAIEEYAPAQAEEGPPAANAMALQGQL